MTNPFKEHTLKSIQREILDKKRKKSRIHVIEVLPSSKVVRLTGEED